MQNNNRLSLLTIMLLILAGSSKAQTGWKELRSYGVNSYTTSNIRSVADDFSAQVVYAAIGSEVFGWKGGTYSWEKLGTDATGLKADGDIYSITADNNHNVYAAGWFTNANGRCYVAKYNRGIFGNGSWTELGGLNSLNPSGPIYSVVSDAAGNIYAAGSFISTTGYRYVAKFDGTSWSELGTGSNALKANSAINALCVDSAGNIYAAGSFTNAASKYYVAKWNGTEWSEMGSGTNALNANARILSVSTDARGHVSAGGEFTNGSNQFYIARWDGSKWLAPGQGTNGFIFNGIVNSVITDIYGQVYAAGEFADNAGSKFVAWWNGTKWDTIGANRLNANAPILSITIDNRSRVFAAGEFTNNNGYKYVADCASIINNWQETAVSGVGTLDATGVATIVSNYKADTLFVGGAIMDANFKTHIFKWGNNSWEDHGSLGVDGIIYSMAIDSNNNIYAAGSLKTSYYNAVFKWDGRSWQELGNSANALKAGYGINNIALDNKGNVYVTGYITNAQGKYYVAKWDGNTWSELGGGINGLNSDELLTALTVDKAGNVYVGSYRYYDYYVSKWDGQNWSYLTASAFDQPLNKISAIAVDSKGYVYSTMSSFFGNWVRVWNGSSWQKLPNTSGIGNLMIDKNDQLFTLLNYKIQRWGGDRFYPLINNQPNEIKADRGFHEDNKGNLYTIGNYANSPTRFIAKYDAVLLAAPFISFINNQCAGDVSSKGKLNNPPQAGNISVMQDGVPLIYNSADSSFEYFSSGVTAPGNHTVMVKYSNGSVVLSDSSKYLVTSNIVAAAEISTPDTIVCANTSFTIACNTNVKGASYQWYLNDWPCVYSCNDSSITFTVSPTNNNVRVYCRVTIPATQCAGVPFIQSNTILMQVGIPTAPEVSITSDDADNIICINQKLLFTAIPVRGGTDPHFQWKINGLNAGTDSNKFEAAGLKDQDHVSVVLSKSISCAVQSATSNSLRVIKDTVSINLKDTLTTVCGGSTTGITIGNAPKPGYQWLWTSNPTGFTSIVSNPIVLPKFNTVYAVVQTNIATGCTSSASITVKVDIGCKVSQNPPYPNPATDYVKIVLDNPVGQDEVILKLVESSGASIFSTKLLNTVNQVDVRHLKAGIYGYIITRNGSIIQEGRLVIVH